MFLGGAGLADYILYCRHKIYPLGLSNGLSHFLTALAVIFSLLLGIGGKYMPPRARPIQVSLIREGQLRGRSEEHTSELQSLMRISYAVFCLKKKRTHNQT